MICIVTTNSFFRRCLACLVAFGALSANVASADTVIALWDFNDGFDVPHETVQIVHAASQGSGTLYQQRADTDGNGKGGVAFADPSLGISVIDGRAMAWDDIAKGGENDAEIFAEFSTIGFTNIRIRFDVQGNGEGADEIVTYDLKYDINPLVDVVNPPDVVGTIKDFAGGLSTEIQDDRPLPANGSTFISDTIDLSGFTDLNNQSTVAIRLDNFKENDAMRIDNFMITGITAVPEPASPAFLCVAFGCVAVRRRR